MMKWERRLQELVHRRALGLGYVALLLLGLMARYALWPLLTADAEFFNVPWLNLLKEGGIPALLQADIMRNYAPINLYLWLLMARLFSWMDTLMLVKLIAVGGELLLCGACCALLRALLPQSRYAFRRFLGFGLLMLNPVLLLNAAGWGQVDTHYTLLCVLAVLLLVQNKPVWAVALMALAFSFKLQAALLLPLFAMVYFRGQKRFSLLWFLLIPGVWLLSGVPMALFGESPLYAVQIYTMQLGQYAQPTFNCPNLYAIMGEALNLNQTKLEMISRIGMAMGAAALGGMAVWTLRRRISLEGRNLVLLGAWCVLCCLFFLPHMHERYGLAGEMLLLCWAVSAGRPRCYLYVLAGMLATLSAYAEFLFRKPFFPLQVGGLLNLALLGALTWEVVRALDSVAAAADGMAGSAGVGVSGGMSGSACASASGGVPGSLGASASGELSGSAGACASSGLSGSACAGASSGVSGSPSASASSGLSGSTCSSASSGPAPADGTPQPEAENP